MDLLRRMSIRMRMNLAIVLSAATLLLLGVFKLPQPA